MAKTPAQAVKELRDLTGLGMMDCKRLLEEAGGDFEKAKDAAIKRGQAKAGKLAGRAATEGIIGLYLHHNKKVGAMVELSCNTDFVARNEEFQQLANDLAAQVVAYSPEAVRREELDQEVVEGLRAHHAESVPKGKPADIVSKIVDGKMRSWYAERVLMDMPFIKEDSKSVEQVIEEKIGKIGENIRIARFTRIQVGEHAEPQADAEE